jgi:hypothetical protein
VSELPSSEDLDPSTGTDAPTPPTTTGPSSYTLNWEEPQNLAVHTALADLAKFLYRGYEVAQASSDLVSVIDI